MARGERESGEEFRVWAGRQLLAQPEGRTEGKLCANCPTNRSKISLNESHFRRFLRKGSFKASLANKVLTIFVLTLGSLYQD